MKNLLDELTTKTQLSGEILLLMREWVEDQITHDTEKPEIKAHEYVLDTLGEHCPDDEGSLYHAMNKVCWDYLYELDDMRDSEEE